MASGYVPPQRSEVVVRGDDEKHEEIRRFSSALIEKNPKVFLVATLLFELCEGT